MASEGVRAFPLSYGQRALWYMQRLFPESPLYNLQSCWRILSDLDIRALRRTFQWLVDRHESLRTTYHLEGREPVQVVHPRRDVFFRVHDASEWTEDEFRIQVDRAVHSPFDLERGPLFRVEIFQREPGRHLLVTTFHHITADLWSMTLIYQEMQRLYAAAREGVLPPPPPAAPYADYVRWQREMLGGREGQRLWDYWRGRFEEPVEELALPFDFARSPSPDCRGQAFPFRLSGGLTARLRELAARSEASLHAVLLAGFETQLHLYSGNALFLIRSLAVGRSRAAWEEIIGFFANPVVMRVDLRGAPSFLEAVSRTQRRVTEAVDHQDFPFELLMERIRFGRRLGFNPMSEVMFVLQAPQRFLSERKGQKCMLEDGMFAPGDTGVRVDFGGFLAEKYNPGTQTTLNDLDIQAVEIGGEVSGIINYRADLFLPGTIAALAADLRRLLEGAVEQPEKPVGLLAERLELARERHQPARVSRVELGTDSRAGGDALFWDSPRGGDSPQLQPPLGSSTPTRDSDPAQAQESENQAVLERRLGEIVGDLLGSGRLAPRDNFFEAGGNSLQALQLTLALREEFKVEVPLRQLFENPTIAGLAAVVLRTARIIASPPILPEARGDHAPLSFAQQRLWFIDRLMGGSFYNVPVAVRLKGPLDIGALQKSLNGIVERHESLRTTYSVVDGRPVQIVRSARPIGVAVEGLRSGTKDERLREAQGKISRLAAQPFDLERGPLLRLTIFPLGEDDHLALLVIHHIAADAWSFGLFLRELTAFYGAAILGGEPAVPELSVQYADYSAWLRRQAERLDREHLAYWKQALDGAPVLEIPADRPRPPVQTFRGGTARFELEAPLVERLRKLCLEEGATPFMALLAAFYDLLHRWSGADDIVVGSPVAGRVRPEVENLIGCFINPLPIRADLGGDPSFRQLLAKVKERALAAFAHQDFPFEKLVEELSPYRDLSREPLFQVMFVLQNAPLPALRLPGGPDLQPFEVERETTRYDLTLFVTESAAAWTCWLEYNSDIFGPESAGRLARHYRNLVENVLESPDRRLSEISAMDEDETESVTRRWNRTRTETAPPACVHELFEKRAAESPGSPAVVFRDAVLSYGEINVRAGAIARALVSRGAGPEKIIGICLERSPDLVAAVLGVLKSGAAYLPLEPSFPKERISQLIGNAGAIAVLSGGEAARRLEGSQAPVFSLENLVRAGEAGRNDAAGVSGLCHPDNLAYVIYTSGSTGKPKGVMVSHRSIVNYLRWCQTAYRLREGQGVLLHSPIAFDFTVTTLLAPLAAGQKIIISPAGPAGPTPAFLEEKAADLTLIKLTPSHARALGRLLGPERVRRMARTLVLGGEALRASQIVDWAGPGGPERIFNEYGPTEATVGCCVRRIAEEDSGRGAIPIGGPIANTRIYILDGFLRPAPLGVPGELCIGGEGLARGYLGRPDLTAERFVPDAWGDEPGDRVYRTGDLARRLADGTIEFLGRLDDQAKVRGYRVETGEVEAALGQLTEIRQAAVVAVPDSAGGDRLRAFIVMGEGQAAAPDDIRAFLRARLPEYMIPAEFSVVERLPLLAGGKVDRRALRAADIRPAKTRPEASLPPRTPAESAVAWAFEEVLGVKGVGAQADFFELGGHSLAAVELVASIQKRFPGAKIGLLEFFKDPSVAGLACRLDLPAQAEGGSGSPPATASLVLLKSGGERAPLFLIHPSGGHARVYRALAAGLETGGPVYGIAARGLAGPDLEQPTIEAMADEYAGIIKKTQSSGPYSLAGWSMGAAVALATAGVLERQGEDVDFLGLLDPTFPMGILDNPASRLADPTLLLRALAADGALEDKKSRELANEFPDLYRSVSSLSAADRAPRLVELVSGRGLVREEGALQALRDFVCLLDVHERLLAAYRPRRICAPIVVWEAETSALAPSNAGPLSGLSSGTLERCQASGNHWEMLSEPFVTELAADMNRRLAERRRPPDRTAPSLPAPAAPRAGAVDSYKVVVNAEEQYSIWPSDSALPNGWREADARGTKVDCLQRVSELWTDLRPLSLKHRSQHRG